MLKLCCIFNTPSLYREAIYKLINETYNCDWYFEDNDNELKLFDIALFERAEILHCFKLGHFSFVRGVIPLLMKKQYQRFLMIGHTRNISVFIFLLLKKLFYRNKKVYLWTHGFYGKENALEFLWKKMFFSFADHLFVYGDYARGLMIKYGFNKNRVSAIHNSLSYNTQIAIRNTIQKTDIYKSYFGNSNPVIIFIGRLTPVKKLDMLIYSIQRLKEMGELYNLVIVGDGTQKDCLFKIVRENGLDNQVWFYGASYDEKVNAKLIYNADLCVAPGNIGLTAVHSLMFGCPAITHNDYSYQMPEFEVIRPNITGDFFHKDDIDSLVHTISLWFLNNSEHREYIRHQCFALIDSEWTPNYQIRVLQSVIK